MKNKSSTDTMWYEEILFQSFTITQSLWFQFQATLDATAEMKYNGFSTLITIAQRKDGGVKGALEGKGGLPE